MGWDFCREWKTKADVVTELVKNLSNSSRYQLVAHKSTTNGLWSVVRNLETGKKLIFFDLIKRERNGFAVKSMEESMGPYFYDCPSSFVYLVPESESGNFNRGWRERYFNANVGKKGFPQDLIGVGVGR